MVGVAGDLRFLLGDSPLGVTDRPGDVLGEGIGALGEGDLRALGPGPGDKRFVVFFTLGDLGGFLPIPGDLDLPLEGLGTDSDDGEES